MKKQIVMLLSMLFAVTFMPVCYAADDSELLEGNEKKIWEEWCGKIPKERRIGIEEFKKLYDKVMAGQEQAYLIDTRTHPEFYAGHIPGTDHVHAGHMYTIPNTIKDKNAKIVVFCRTHKRQCYVGGFLSMYGYTNVWLYDGGLVDWIKAGYPLCNQFMGKFTVTEYHKEFTGKYKDGPNAGKDKDPHRIREFHPY